MCTRPASLRVCTHSYLSHCGADSASLRRTTERRAARRGLSRLRLVSRILSSSLACQAARLREDEEMCEEALHSDRRHVAELGRCAGGVECVQRDMHLEVAQLLLPNDNTERRPKRRSIARLLDWLETLTWRLGKPEVGLGGSSAHQHTAFVCLQAAPRPRGAAALACEERDRRGDGPALAPSGRRPARGSLNARGLRYGSETGAMPADGDRCLAICGSPRARGWHEGRSAAP